MRYRSVLRIIVLFSLFISILIPWRKTQANTFLVVNTNDSGPGSLRQAITDANNNPGPDTITFATSTNGIPIVLTSTTGDDSNVSGDLDILDGGSLTIQGNGYPSTIIDGGGIDRVFHICPSGGCTHTITLMSMTIRNGTIFGEGGGIYNEGAPLVIQSTLIGGVGVSNQALGGGGIYNHAGTTTVENCIISGNVALIGGGILNNGGSLTILNGSYIGVATGQGNQAGDGGGIYNQAGTTTVDDSKIKGNTVTEDGAGIYNQGMLIVQNSSIIGGIGAGNNADINGGGIYNDENGDVTIDNSTLSANTASGGNGGGIWNRAILSVQNNSLIGGTGAGNTVTNYGGGIYNFDGGNVTIDGSTISANTAEYGGGIFTHSTETENQATLNVQNGSLIGGYGGSNQATVNGGGIFNGYFSTTTVDSSTVSANEATSGAGIWNQTRLFVQNNSTIGGAGAGNQSVDSGGGIYNMATATVDSSTVSANEAFRGGGIYNMTLLHVMNGSIIGGAGEGNRASQYGGGIYNDNGRMTLDDSIVSANNAEHGGGIFSNAELVIQNGSMVGEIGASNHAYTNGGGVANNGTMTMDSSTVSANTADSFGGGIYNNGTLNTTFSTIGGVNGGNQANNGGGGIYNGYVGTVILDSSTVSANTGNAAGGGVYNLYSLNIQNGSVIGEAGLQNSAGYGGGINNLGTTTVHASTVSANHASTFGGGIFNQAILIVQNGSIIGGTNAGNQADSGGGIYNETDGTTTVDGSTINANTASVSGGGIYNKATLNVENGSIIGKVDGENVASSDGGGIYNLDGIITVDNSTIGVNEATNGGGIYNEATLNVQNGSTIGGFQKGNVALEYGGGLYNHSGSISFTGSRILNNAAAIDGGGVYNDVNTIGATTVINSCIVGNQSISYLNNQAAMQNATGNWWGAATGPNSPSADTYGGSVDVSGYLTTPILDCAPNLGVSKTNDTSGNVPVGKSFQWILTVANTGLISATFEAGQTILFDELPTGATYGAPIAGQYVDVVNSTNIQCTKVSNSITCAVISGDVTLGPLYGSFEVTISVTPQVLGNLINPMGNCQVDPDEVISEDDESNNDCPENAVNVTPQHVFLPLLLR